MCRYAQRRFECRPESARTGRYFVAEILREWGVGAGDPAADGLEDLLLMASELLTNALRVCAGPITVEITAHRASIELSVQDDSPAPVVVRRPELVEPGGRGLQIVEVLSARWGQRAAGGASKQVWCEVAVPAGSVIGNGCTR